MLTYEDCLGMTDLTQNEVEAIAEHEHCHEIIALELGDYLMHTADGRPRIRTMILEDIATAEASGHPAHAEKLKLVLRQFCARFGEAAGSAAL